MRVRMEIKFDKINEGVAMISKATLSANSFVCDVEMSTRTVLEGETAVLDMNFDIDEFTAILIQEVKDK